MGDGRYAAFGRAVDRCESPIERRLLVAWLFSEHFSFAPVKGATGVVAEDAYGIVLAQQITVARHRLDFALKRNGCTARIAVECDGFRYHDASPEQATRDRARDRELAALGWVVVRYTGKELIQDALGCAREAHRLMLRLTPSAANANRPTIVKAGPGGQLQLGAAERVG